jgi:sugar lactone lactonase YvrE
VNASVRRISLLGALGLAVLPGCKSRADRNETSSSTTKAASARIAAVSGLSSAEAVVFDSARDVYFVSNINGDAGVKDGNGFISRITADGVVDSLHFIQGGRGGVTLNGPMGSRIKGDTLWVVDVDALRGFDARTGAPVAAIDLAPAGAAFLNDLTLGPDNDFYITDTGVRTVKGKSSHTGPDRIYHVDSRRRVSIAVESPALSMPDGIAWDRRARRLVLAPFGGKAVQQWRPGEAAPTNVAPGPGHFDGAEVESDGRIIITIWDDSSVSLLSDNHLVKRLVLSMPPADASVDSRRGRIGVVSIDTDRFELWPWPR